MILDRVKVLCAGKGISITALEQKLGYGKGTILGWDSKSPTIAKIEPVATYFGVSIDYLVKGK